MTATTTLPITPVARPIRTDGDRIVLRDISWERYTELRDDPAQMRIRMSYFHGVLELMSPSGPHERIKRLLEALIDAWCSVHKIPAVPFGSTTYRQEKKAAGLEPDTCYYIQSARLLGGKSEIDLSVDPPPDLAVEVDITSSSLDRLKIYAALGIPEVWRTNGEWFLIYRLKVGSYSEVARSEVFPTLSIAELIRFLQRVDEWNITALVEEFRTWAASQKPSA